MECRQSSPNRLHRSFEQIPYDSIERDQVGADQKPFYLLTSASFVEITSDVYTSKLVDCFHEDPAVRSWLAKKWQREELRHGFALEPIGLSRSIRRVAVLLFLAGARYLS